VDAKSPRQQARERREQAAFDRDPIAFMKREAAQWRGQVRVDTYGDLAYYDGAQRREIAAAVHVGCIAVKGL